MWPVCRQLLLLVLREEAGSWLGVELELGGKTLKFVVVEAGMIEIGNHRGRGRWPLQAG